MYRKCWKISVKDGQLHNLVVETLTGIATKPAVKIAKFDIVNKFDTQNHTNDDQRTGNGQREKLIEKKAHEKKNIHAVQ